MFGEVFICQLPFTSGMGGKVRPALVLFDLRQDAVICRVTSVSRAGTLEITLSDWKATGLLRSSVARLDRLVTAEKTAFLRRLGVLSAADLADVRNTWNAHMTL